MFKLSYGYSPQLKEGKDNDGSKLRIKRRERQDETISKSPSSLNDVIYQSVIISQVLTNNLLYPKEQIYIYI